MSFVQLRFTHSLLDISALVATGHLRKYLNDLGVEQFIMCVEQQDKFGKETHEHIHCNFIEPNGFKKDTLQKKFKQKLLVYDITVSGNKHYSLRVVAQPEDEDRWWRYCLKEKNKMPILQKGHDKEQMKEWRLLARDERERQIKKNNEDLDRYLDKSSFNGKMFQKFKEEEVIGFHNFGKRYINYCMENSKVPSFSKIEDYYYLYKIQMGLMTADEYMYECQKPDFK